MMVGRAVVTGVLDGDEHVRGPVSPSDERHGRRRRDPGAAASEHGLGAPAERDEGAVHRAGPGVPGGVAAPYPQQVRVAMTETRACSERRRRRERGARARGGSRCRPGHAPARAAPSPCPPPAGPSSPSTAHRVAPRRRLGPGRRGGRLPTAKRPGRHLQGRRRARMTSGQADLWAVMWTTGRSERRTCTGRCRARPAGAGAARSRVEAGRAGFRWRTSGTPGRTMGLRPPP
jgi:hypothetical protein